MMDHADPLYFRVKKEKVGALTILTPSLRLLTVDSLPTIPSPGAPVAVTTLVKMSMWGVRLTGIMMVVHGRFPFFCSFCSDGTWSGCFLE